VSAFLDRHQQRSVETQLAWTALQREGGLEHAWVHPLGKALPHQRWPSPDAFDWSLFLLVGGRGAGKTRAGAEWIRYFVRDETKGARIALVSETYADGREVMIDGVSGLARIGPLWERPRYEPSRRRLLWPSGAVGYHFSSEEPDGLRGHAFDAAWSDELCKWKYPEETWSNLQLALRAGRRPRQWVTTTPRPMALLKRLIAAPGAHVSRATTFDNEQNLSRAFLDEVAAALKDCALGRQEILGEIVEDLAGALWTNAMIDAARISVPPEFHTRLDRIVVAVDPPAGQGAGAAECGIVVAGRLEAATCFVLADRSVHGLSPKGWAERAVAAYHEFAADRIVVEANQGGAMARQILRLVDPSAPVREVYAARGKRARAEPVAALYEQGRVRHVASFPKLEDQMRAFTGGEAESPDRLDALVWAVFDLMLRRRGAPRVARLL
jgi:phage terminase large subunit-like protein